MKELAALGRVSAREKLAAKRRAKQQARQALKQKEKATERSLCHYIWFIEQLYDHYSVEPPNKRPRLSVSEDDEMTTEEFSVDDNITEEVLLWLLWDHVIL